MNVRYNTLSALGALAPDLLTGGSAPGTRWDEMCLQLAFSPYSSALGLTVTARSP